jgi:hypothetical protein
VDSWLNFLVGAPSAMLFFVLCGVSLILYLYCLHKNAVVCKCVCVRNFAKLLQQYRRYLSIVYFYVLRMLRLIK